MDKFFKTSKKSICHECFNINEKCSLIEKTCGTDSKIGQSFVQKCSMFNRSKSDMTYSGSFVVAKKADTRNEMMGGGFNMVEKYKDNVENP